MLPIYTITGREAEVGFKAQPTDRLVMFDHDTDIALYANPGFARILRPLCWLWLNRWLPVIIGVRLGFLYLADPMGYWRSARFTWRFWSQPRSWWVMRKHKPIYRSRLTISLPKA